MGRLRRDGITSTEIHSQSDGFRVRFLSPALGILLAVAVAVAAAFVPDGINLILDQFGGQSRVFADPLFKTLIALVTFLVTFSLRQAARLERTLDQSLHASQRQLADAVEKNFNKMPVIALVRHIESDSDTSEHIARALDTIRQILSRQQPTIKSSAAALLPIFIDRWEAMVGHIQRKGVSLNEGEFYDVIHTLLKNSETFQLIDPTVYESIECWTPTFRDTFAPRMSRHLRGEDPKTGSVEYLTVIASEALSASKSRLEEFSKWFNKFTVPHFVVSNEGIDKNLSREFGKTCLFVFDGSLVVTMSAAQNWNVPRPEWEVTLLVADSQIKTYVAQANRHKVRLVPSA